ncbi:hypothetical protein ILUMI_18557, partial [Ignelater luminosus]
KLQRVLDYVVRFIKNLSSKESRSSGPLTNSEMNEATVLLIKMVQAVELAEDILTLKKNGSVARNKWKFVPPRAPHFAGLWERGVRSVKHHLKRVIGNANLTYENFYTILTQIESVLNSRPLCPLTQDHNDLEPLTPGHFLIGSPLTSYPQVVESPTSSGNLSAFRHRQLLINHFWNRWSKEYINNLQQRSKWKVRGQQTFHAGQLVIVKEDNVPPLCWKMGRIVQVYPGADGVVNQHHVTLSELSTQQTDWQRYSALELFSTLSTSLSMLDSQGRINDLEAGWQ